MRREGSWVSGPGVYGAFSCRMHGNGALRKVDHTVRRYVKKREVGGERIAAVEGQN